MLFSRSRHLHSEQTSLKMSEEIIQPTHCVNVLGLLIDDKLVWHEHINVCIKKHTSALYAINKVNHFIPVDWLVGSDQ